jgi:hypothetical protein
MMKTRLIAMFMASLVLFYTSCSEKEVPNPVEDTQRIDALRNELRTLQEKIYGEQLANDLLTAEAEDLNALIEDLEAEIATLEAIYNQAVTYTVIAIDNLGNPIPGASVTVNQDGALVTKTTGNDGSIQIENVRAGTVAAVVSAAGYSTVNYYATLAFAQTAGVNTRVVMIPKTSTNNTYLLKGYLYANTNLANDTAGGVHYNGASFIGWKGTDAATKVAGVLGDNRTYEKVSKKMIANLWVNVNYVPFSQSTGNGGNSADLIELAYEDVSVEATFDANNQYTLRLPVTSIYHDAWGDNVYYDWEITFEEFVANQTLVEYDPNGTLSGGAPHTAWPMPKTYTLSRKFTTSDYEGSGWGSREAGDVVIQNFFYSASAY